MGPDSTPASFFEGRWRIVAADLWDREALDLVEPAFIEINGQQGQMRLIAVVAWLDLRFELCDGRPSAQFSWEGFDDGDARCGRGWLAPDQAGALLGHFFIHGGDDSGFACEPWRSRPPRRRARSSRAGEPAR